MSTYTANGTQGKSREHVNGEFKEVLRRRMSRRPARRKAKSNGHDPAPAGALVVEHWFGNEKDIAVALRRHPHLTPAEKDILTALALHDFGNCQPSIERLCRMTGRNRRTVRRAIRKAEGLGWLSVRRTGRASVYTFNTYRPYQPDEAPHAPGVRGGQKDDPIRRGQKDDPPKKNKKIETREGSLHFSKEEKANLDKFLAAYPQDVGVEAAFWKWWRVALNDGATAEGLIAQAGAYARAMSAEGKARGSKFIPKPEYWLRDQQWELDWRPEARDPETRAKAADRAFLRQGTRPRRPKRRAPPRYFDIKTQRWVRSAGNGP